MTEGRASALQQCIEEALERLPSAPGRHAIERGFVLPVLQAARLGDVVFELNLRGDERAGVTGVLLCTNSVKRKLLAQARAATEVAGLEFGKDVIVDFGPTRE